MRIKLNWLCINKWNDDAKYRGWKQWRDALSRQYMRYTYKFLAARRTFSECIIAKAGRNYRLWDIFQSRLQLFGPIGPEIEWIARTVTAITRPPRRITIVNSIWIAAKLNGTVNYVRMTASPRANLSHWSIRNRHRLAPVFFFFPLS